MNRLAAALLLLASCASPAPVELTDHEKYVLRGGAASDDADRGDEAFLKAVRAERSGDADGALKHFAAARTHYLQAQLRYTGLASVPAPLLDRVKECVTRIAALQRQRHATPAPTK
ncbi:MAG TPA: hypothetical protein VM222_00865 [Planctomycetota bacterium]|nr:hypothetical protein [Planctomycetota bacterium]